jgi:hypothetical protein
VITQFRKLPEKHAIALLAESGAIGPPNAIRLSMTGDLVERMCGHRTRLAQDFSANCVEENQALACYLDESRALDRVRTHSKTAA